MTICRALIVSVAVLVGCTYSSVGTAGDEQMGAEAKRQSGHCTNDTLQRPPDLSGVSPGVSFQECTDHPIMTVIAAGHFTMKRKSARDGRKDDDPEGVPKSKPSREVTIDKAFAIGTYPVTRQEFEIFVRETHRAVESGCHVQKAGVWVFDQTKDWRNPGFAQTERDPVTCMNWNDAEDYVQWLNDTNPKTARADVGPYRIPTWEEMEYAAGGGSPSTYYWGERSERDKANYGAERCLPCKPKKEGADRWLYTSPVGSFPPNPFGLYDMAGNVWQWAQGCWPDPSATPTRNCRSQVLHGGSWLTNPENLSTGEYSSADVRHRNNEIGFRVARTLK